MVSPEDEAMDGSHRPTDLEVVVYLLVHQDEAQHGPAETPLVAALLEQHDLKQGAQQLREEVRGGPRVFSHSLGRQRKGAVLTLRMHRVCMCMCVGNTALRLIF